MLATTTASATFAVRDLAAAKEFYGDVLGLRVTEAYGGAILQLHLAGGCRSWSTPSRTTPRPPSPC